MAKTGTRSKPTAAAKVQVIQVLTLVRQTKRKLVFISSNPKTDAVDKLYVRKECLPGVNKLFLDTYSLRGAFRTCS